MAPPKVTLFFSQFPLSRVVAGTSAENEGSKKVKKKKIKKKEDFCGFKMRFNSKWLGDLAQQLSPRKQGIIQNGLFGNLLDIKPFKVPHALIEFVVMHTNHALLEFKYKNKSIKFSKNMVKRIFNVPSGDSPMKLLKKSDEHDLHGIYKEGNRRQLPMFSSCSRLQRLSEAMIRRTWALVVLAIVVCPGTGNMVNLEYLPSLENMDLVHNLAWDEHLLARATEEVAIIYMDHLDIHGLPNEHVIDYYMPRIRYVCQKDFDWVDKVDKNKLTLVQPFYGKHTQFRTLCNTPYAEVIGPEVDREAATGQGARAEATNSQGSQNEVPEAQENVEVLPNLSSSFDDWLQQPFPSMDDLKDAQDEAATPTMDEAREKEKDAQDEAEAATPPMDEAREKEKDAQAATSCIGDQAKGMVAVMSKDEVVGEMEKKQDVAEDAGQTREQQRVSMEVEVHVPPQGPPLFHDAPRSATADVWDDEPSCELFPKGSEDFNLMHGMNEPTNNNKTCNNLYPNIPVFPVSDDDGSPTIPAQTMGVADEQPIDVGSGPSTHDKNTRKKRMAKVPAVKPKGKKQKVEVKEDKVKAIYEKYIMHGKPLRRTPFIKIGGFYVGYKSLLKQDPSIFQPNALMAELERAVTKFKVQKYDTLWFAVVHERHWIVVCANLLHKQWNAFDSISAKGKPLTLKKHANNLCDAFNVNVASFTRADLEDYPKQNNLCDCGFFAVKYAENFDGKAMKGFEQYRMEWAYNFDPSPSTQPQWSWHSEELATDFRMVQSEHAFH
ncbi:hypothetical protein ZWY2020_010530 [Hordeum vulgare]|nr:hypothetical protein ZWY2020_010530 [Hordeum vulgare]